MNTTDLNAARLIDRQGAADKAVLVADADRGRVRELRHPAAIRADLPTDGLWSQTAGAADDEAGQLDAVVISDLHLGSDNCQAKRIGALLNQLLDGQMAARRLIINGDVFDSIDFRRLKKTHWKVLSLIRHLSDKIEVIWTSGNHDGPAEIISHLLGVQVQSEYVLESGGRRMLVIHGDLFDDFIDHHPLLTWLGDLIYNTLQKLDKRHYIARLAKSRSKTFLHCMDKVRVKSMAYARKKDCDVVICGHTHLAAAVREGPVEYYNSGCWTELPTTYLTITAGEVMLHHSSALTEPAEEMAESLTIEPLQV